MKENTLVSGKSYLPLKYYGTEVKDFSCFGIDSWKLFNYDGKNVYLIPKVHMQSSLLTKSQKDVNNITDREVWSVGNEFVEYAIGGPTFEMFASVYNRLNYIKIDYEKDDKGCYRYKWSTTNEYKEYINEMINYRFLFYNPYDNIRVWMAVETANVDKVPVITERGAIMKESKDYDESEVGFKPLICLKDNLRVNLAGKIVTKGMN